MDRFQAVALLAFVIAFLLALVLMPLAVTFGHRYEMVARPRFYRKSRSHQPIFYLGGTALATSTVSASFIAAGTRSPLAAALGAGLILVALGFRENTRRLKSVPLALRLCFQAVLAALVWWVEFQGQLPGLSGAAIAVLLLVGAANAFNLLDNMNGVAGMTSAATAAGLVGLALFNGIPQAAAPVAALCGASLAFLRHNLVRARIFLGGGGPEFIGFVLGATALKVCMALGPVWGMVATVTVLAVPLTDSAVTIGARIVSGRPAFKGGVDHLSHRLVRLGLSTRRVAVLHGLVAVGASVMVALAFRSGPTFLLAGLGIIVLGGFAITLAGGREDEPRPKKRRAVYFVIFAGAAVTLFSAAPAAVAARDLYSTRSALLQGIASLRALDVDAAKQSFLTGERLAARAEQRLNSPITIPARLVPIVRDNMNAARALATGSNLLALAAVDALGAADVFPRGPNGPELSLKQGRIDPAPWRPAEDKLQRAAAGARLALKGVRAANGILLPPVASARRELLVQGGRALETLQKSADAAGLIPYVFGVDRPRTWFLAIQNPVEQRATGGFLGAFGILRSESGKLSLERFQSNNELPPVPSPPPAPAEYVAHYDQFSSRTTWSNVNMTPDFPTSASVIAGMWEKATGRHIDGVMAIDAIGLKHLLTLVGPVDVDPVGQISSDNFLSLALNEAYIRFPQKENRATFLLEVGRQVWQRLLGGSFSDPRPLTGALSGAVSGKHFQVWSPEEQSRIKRLELSGELEPPGDSDYLMVVGQNAAGNKVDYYARRQIVYQVDLTDPSNIRGRLEVRIDNGAPPSGLPQYILGPTVPSDPPGLNRSYTSVFMAPRTGVLSTLVDGKSVQFESHSEKGHGVVSRFVEVLPGKSSVLALSLRGSFPLSGTYRLVVQHQPALYPDQLRIDITLPPGAPVRASSDGMEVEGGHAVWRGILDRDREFFVTYGVTPIGRRDSAVATPARSLDL